MGQAASRLTQPVRDFNIENRASKALEKRQTVAEPAPKHESTKQKLSHFREEHPELLETVTSKNDNLHERLKQIYVDSEDAPIQIKSSAKSLPLSREPRLETELGVMDVDYELPAGKADLKTILKFIGDSQANPGTVTAAGIAESHGLDAAEVQHVLNHFRALQIYLPPEMYKENKNLKTIVQQQMASGSVISSQFKLTDDPTGKTASENVKIGDHLNPEKN